MKFSEMPYTRPDYAAAAKELDSLTARLRGAASAQEQVALYKEYETLLSHLSTQATLCSIRHTVDTRDAFYEEENNYNDEQAPLLEEKLQPFRQALLASPYRAELEESLGKLLFQNMELEEKAFSPEIVPLMQEENRMANEYQKLYASAQIPFMGKTVTVAQLGPYKESTDRTTRRAALEAEGSFFDENREQFDELFDKLVKNRTQQAKALGFDSFVELGAIRRMRNCYTPADVASFRDQVVRDLVPLTVKIKERQAKRLGIAREDFTFTDNALSYKDGSATPQGTPEEILAAGKKMYEELSPETRDFIHLMFDNELFDVLAKDGKAPGGYCTSLPDYQCPFIFSNFNGTSGDVDVLTHEAGHAFAAWMNRDRVPMQYTWPTMEACECHSMSMEFFAWPWAEGFFGADAAKFRYSHLAGALTFIPYGTAVDHFQHIAYEKPDLTPAQRHAEWKRLLGIYMPWLRLDGDIPFYGDGESWQQKHHIYSSPFYYIDYCLAQTVSLEFWAMIQQDRQNAWDHYMAYTRQGGTKVFTELLKNAGLESPFEENCLRTVCEAAGNWLDNFDLSALH